MTSFKHKLRKIAEMANKAIDMALRGLAGGTTMYAAFHIFDGTETLSEVYLLIIGLAALTFIMYFLCTAILSPITGLLQKFVES